MNFNDVVANVVNLRYRGGAIGNVESYVQAAYGYDVRTEIVGSKGSIRARGYTIGVSLWAKVLADKGAVYADV